MRDQSRFDGPAQGFQPDLLRSRKPSQSFNFSRTVTGHQLVAFKRIPILGQHLFAHQNIDTDGPDEGQFILKNFRNASRKTSGKYRPIAPMLNGMEFLQCQFHLRW